MTHPTPQLHVYFGQEYWLHRMVGTGWFWAEHWRGQEPIWHGPYLTKAIAMKEAKHTMKEAWDFDNHMRGI